MLTIPGFSGQPVHMRQLYSHLRSRSCRSFQWLALFAIAVQVACSATETRQAPLPATNTVRATTKNQGRLLGVFHVEGQLGRGTAIRMDDLEPLLLELAAQRATRELVLDRLLRGELLRSGIVLNETAVQREAMILRNALDADANRAQRLLDGLRERERLGTVRWQALLRRNASLRALVAPEIQPNDAIIRAAWDRNHGERREARIIVVEALATCGSIRSALESGASFSELAGIHSTDSSGAVGGRVQAISELDPSWPASIRNAIFTLDTGESSDPLLINDSYVLVQCTAVVPGDGVEFDTARIEAERHARLAQERIAMDQLAESLLAGVQFEFYDETLQRAFRQKR